jgi:hypothetical protein
LRFDFPALALCLSWSCIKSWVCDVTEVNVSDHARKKQKNQGIYVMKISKFLVTSLLLSASALGTTGLISRAAEPQSPPTAPGGAPMGGGGSPSAPAGGLPDPVTPSSGAPAGGGGSPSAPAEPLPTTPTGKDPVDPSGAPSSAPAPSSTTTPEPSSDAPPKGPKGGGSLSPSSESPSGTSSARIFATCGPGGASLVFNDAAQVPAGCRATKVNSLPDTTTK